ncbi:TerD family protein [Sediminitomix flava]|uniref:Tellurium resistance protein TerZ n=1 Tax=Sediminitomix flava TaxID=379075 RepID=A0A315ZNC7_SEDFL|nr:TerD family protein [Sediminitomix flava]PWJ36009.1 tellurium resistance protein TerZ [Sediminitomix flava]
MAISLNKKTGINLKKGSSISLEKEGNQLREVCIGLNWGMIEKKAFFGLFDEKEKVDLDASAALFDQNGEALDVVYFNKLKSDDLAIIHSGDDRSGDEGGDDGFDNEVIQVKLSDIDSKVSRIFFFLNSYEGHDFADIPYSKIRIFEGNSHEVRDVLATFDLSADISYKGYVSMLMGVLDRDVKGWKFTTLGNPVETKRVEDTVNHIKGKFFRK